MQHHAITASAGTLTLYYPAGMQHHAITASTGTLTLYYPAGMQHHAITASAGKLTLALPHLLGKPNDRHKFKLNSGAGLFSIGTHILNFRFLAWRSNGPQC